MNAATQCSVRAEPHTHTHAHGDVCTLTCMCTHTHAHARPHERCAPPLCITHVLVTGGPPSLPSGSTPPTQSGKARGPAILKRVADTTCPWERRAPNIKHVKPPWLVLRNSVPLTSFNIIYRHGGATQPSVLHEGPSARSRSRSVRHHRLPPTRARTEIQASGAASAHYDMSTHKRGHCGVPTAGKAVITVAEVIPYVSIPQAQPYRQTFADETAHEPDLLL